MKKMYAVRDSKSGVYHPPRFNLTEGEALRDFHAVTHDDKTMICRYPEDYDLFYLGTFDEQTGKMNTLETPQHLKKAVELKQQQPTS